MCNVSASPQAYLPRCVPKYDLIQYFGCDYSYLWENIVTEEMVSSWGFDWEEIKRKKRLPPEVTLEIYVHYRITDLYENYSERIAQLIEQREEQTQ